MSAATLAPDSLVAAVARFVVRRGGFATAVIERMGSRAARIVLIGADGRWSDHVAVSVAQGQAVCEAAGIEVADGWSRELVGRMRSVW